MTKFLEVALEVARDAGKIQKNALGKVIKIGYKGNKANVVTEIDHKCEKYIVQQIKKAFPDHAFFAEEGTDEKSNSPYKWIIDPLDGTVNYSHGLPMFAVSIGLEYKGKIVTGVGYGAMLDEMYYAEKGKGAYLNGKRIHVSKTKDLKTAIVCTGFSYDVQTNPNNNLNNFAQFVLNAQAVRRVGSAVLDLCYLACGRFDGFWELYLHAWDVAASSLIITEAGGKITTFNGSKYSVYSHQTLASNGKIHRLMVAQLAKSNKD